MQIFENRGETMGCSNPHPHCQLWATDHMPWLPAQEQDRQVRYLRSHGSPLLIDYLDQELLAGERLVMDQRRVGCAGSLVGRVAV